MQIGFIGLGHMGAPMVQNLLAAGHLVKVYDINPSAMAALEPFGAEACDTLAAAVKGAACVFTMLQTGEQVKQSCSSDHGIFSLLDANSLFIDSSTIDIQTSLQLHQQAKEKGIAMLDAPVSGGVAAAEAGSLTFLVGGNEADVTRANVVLTAMGSKILHAGAAGCGLAAKICNNMVLGVTMIAVSEAYILGAKLGLKPELIHQVFANASAQCWINDHYCPWPNILEKSPASNGYKPGFSAKMMLKDLLLAEQAISQQQINAVMAALATEQYQAFVDQVGGGDDFSGIIKHIE